MVTAAPLSERPAAVTLAQTFADVSRRLAGQTTDATWQSITEAATTMISGAEAAGVSVLRGSEFHTLAPTSALPQLVDAIQYELRSGPCVDAILSDNLFRTGDLAEDDRWPEFGRRASAEHGVKSMLAFRLFIDDDQAIGALNVYSTQREAFGDSAVWIGDILATHAAIALSGATSSAEAGNLQAALASSREIGIALGVLMSRNSLTSEQAFALLRVASQHSHRKLRDVASEVAHTGALDYPPTNAEDASDMA